MTTHLDNRYPMKILERIIVQNIITVVQIKVSKNTKIIIHKRDINTQILINICVGLISTP